MSNKSPRRSPPPPHSLDTADIINRRLRGRTTVVKLSAASLRIIFEGVTHLINKADLSYMQIDVRTLVWRGVNSDSE